ncbi:ATP-binding protein [Ornithinimicrobium cerasi]|uniref:ATP-binding protein n=1 Tax=Ornithinimicrobium cerasi TaxID=2248773 RepID=UPI000EFF38E2|nr:helix-turn-helix domain-containing protein [Ornithinimicrobium cerasi]
MDGASGGGPPTFAQRLRSLREAASLSQEALAERAGISTDAVSSLERGTRTHPYPATVRALADALTLSPAERAALTAAVPSRHRPSASGRSAPAGPRAQVPVAPTPLLGREDDVAALSQLLTDPAQRLVTLTGIGGIGKSRLAAAVAERRAGQDRDGVVFVALDSVPHESLMLAEIGLAAALRGPHLTSGEEAIPTDLTALQALLVLDNVEHLTGAGRVVADLLSKCPDLTVLATSRVPLRVRGEFEYAVPPLALPTVSDPESLSDFPAAALLIQRGRAVRKDFALRPDDVAAVVGICHRLGGIPLALELAAGGLRAFDPPELLTKLEEVLELPGPLDLPARQRTLRAALDWSYAQQSEADQTSFRQLGVFAGGFSLQAAETVVGATPAAVDRLTTYSLCALARTDQGHSRYAMLQPIAHYARSLLSEDESEDVHRAHGDFFVSLAERATSGYHGDHQADWMQHLDRETANISAAYEWAVRSGAGDLAGRFASALWMYWWMRGQLRWARPMLERTLRLPMTETIRARTLIAAGGIAEPGVDIPAVEDRYRQALDLAVKEGDQTTAASALLALGAIALEAHRLDTAQQRLVRALQTASRAGDSAEWYTGHAHILLGATLRYRGDPRAAIDQVRAALESARARGDGVATTIALYNLGQAELSLGRHQVAARHLREAVPLCLAIDDAPNLALILDALAAAALTTDPERAATLLGAAEAMRHSVGFAGYGSYAPDRARRDWAADQARQTLGESRYHGAVQAGRSLDLHSAAALALEPVYQH